MSLREQIKPRISKEPINSKYQWQHKYHLFITWRGLIQKLGTLENVFISMCWKYKIVLREVLPYKSILVAPESEKFTYTSQYKYYFYQNSEFSIPKVPLARPGIHFRHPLPSQNNKPIDHIYNQIGSNKTFKNVNKDTIPC